MNPDQLRRTYTLLETLLDYLPGPQSMRSAASDEPQRETPRTYSAAELDQQIARLEHQERLRRGDYGRSKEPWENARLQQYRQGDYAALDAALLDLEVVNATWSGLAWRVASHHPGVLDLSLRVQLVETVRWLAGRLPCPARVPSWTQSSAPPTVAHLAALRALGVPVSMLVRVYGERGNVKAKRAKETVA